MKYLIIFILLFSNSLYVFSAENEDVSEAIKVFRAAVKISFREYHINMTATFCENVYMESEEVIQEAHRLWLTRNYPILKKAKKLVLFLKAVDTEGYRDIYRDFANDFSKKLTIMKLKSIVILI